MRRGTSSGAAVLSTVLLCGTVALLPGSAVAVPGPEGGIGAGAVSGAAGPGAVGPEVVTGAVGAEEGPGTARPEAVRGAVGAEAVSGAVGREAVSGAVGDDPASLPAVTQRLSDDSCRKASERKVVGLPWPQALLRPDMVWPLSDGAGVTVAVVGSGVDDTAGLLGDRLRRTPRLFAGGGPAADCVGHGTFTAGLIAAPRTPGAGFAGIAPEARILDVPVTDRRGNTTPALLARGIRAAVGGGARVIAVVAVAGTDSPALRSAVRYAVAEGAVVIAPAAPDGAKGPAYPAAHPQVVAVAATGPGGKASGQAPEGRVDLT
ncbi:S8 family serine peptidase, partial [Streptomyces sp. NPDC056049]|uniref:S8 family serine peptidase n=1 Tax=Streptomyces sp. NPDC056049 TaxID=3345693 RepID=UPI0035DD36ED